MPECERSVRERAEVLHVVFSEMEYDLSVVTKKTGGEWIMLLLGLCGKAMKQEESVACKKQMIIFPLVGDFSNACFLLSFFFLLQEQLTEKPKLEAPPAHQCNQDQDQDV